MSSAIRTLVQPEMPSPQEALNEWRKHAPKMRVYNGGTEWFIEEYDGNPYFIPPDLGGILVDHPVFVERHENGEPKINAETGNLIPVRVAADGVAEIGDLFGHLYDRFGRREGTGPIPGNQGMFIVWHLQRAHGYRGICWLRGDAKDETRKENARLLYRQHMRNWAIAEVQTFQTTVANWRARPGHKATPPPRPTDAQVRAQEFLDTFQETQDDVFACVVCYGYHTKEWGRFANHMRKAHGVEVDEKEYAKLQAKAEALRKVSADDAENETARTLRAMQKQAGAFEDPDEPEVPAKPKRGKKPRK